MQPTADPQPSPDNAKQLAALSLVELTYEVEWSNEWRSFLPDYWRALFVTIGYGTIAWLEDSHPHPSILGSFFGLVCVMLSWLDASQRREKRRWKLLIKTLREAQQ